MALTLISRSSTAEKGGEPVDLLFLMQYSIKSGHACNRFVHAAGSDSTELTSSVSMYSLISRTLPSPMRMTKQYALLPRADRLQSEQELAQTLLDFTRELDATTEYEVNVLAAC